MDNENPLPGDQGKAYLVQGQHDHDREADGAATAAPGRRVVGGRPARTPRPRRSRRPPALETRRSSPARPRGHSCRCSRPTWAACCAATQRRVAGNARKLTLRQFEPWAKEFFGTEEGRIPGGPGAARARPGGAGRRRRRRRRAARPRGGQAVRAAWRSSRSASPFGARWQTREGDRGPGRNVERPGGGRRLAAAEFDQALQLARGGTAAA
jgi:hypothetical protein